MGSRRRSAPRPPATPRPSPKQAAPGKRTQTDPHAITPAQELFIAAYTANGGNGTRAYRETHPLANATTCSREAWRLLRTPKIRAEIERRRADRLKRLEMEGDEAVALLAMRARADIADAYDDDGTILPVEQWPESLRLCVREVDGDKIKLYDGLKAAELVAVATGRIRGSIDIHHFDHAKYLAGLEDPPPNTKTED